MRATMSSPATMLVAVAFALVGCAGSTQPGDGPTTWMRRSDVEALAGPEPTGHEAVIRTWFAGALHLPGPGEALVIGPVSGFRYVELETGLLGGERVRWFWHAQVEVQRPDALSRRYDVAIRQGSVVFALQLDDRTRIAADGSVVAPNTPIPGLDP